MRGSGEASRPMASISFSMLPNPDAYRTLILANVGRMKFLDPFLDMDELRATLSDLAEGAKRS